MAKVTDGGWLAASKKRYGDQSGGGGREKLDGSTMKGSSARMGKKDGGESGATPYGNSKGGGSGPRGKNRPQNNPRGIGLTSKRKD